MACRSLGELNVLGLVVEVRQDGRAETDGGNVLGETCICFNAVAHTPYLGIGQRDLAAKDEIRSITGNQVLSG